MVKFPTWLVHQVQKILERFSTVTVVPGTPIYSRQQSQTTAVTLATSIKNMCNDPTLELTCVSTEHSFNKPF